MSSCSILSWLIRCCGWLTQWKLCAQSLFWPWQSLPCCPKRPHGSRIYRWSMFRHRCRYREWPRHRLCSQVSNKLHRCCLGLRRTETRQVVLSSQWSKDSRVVASPKAVFWYYRLCRLISCFRSCRRPCRRILPLRWAPHCNPRPQLHHRHQETCRQVYMIIPTIRSF